MIGMDHQPAPKPKGTGSERPRIPIWRRITALFTLSFMTIVAGVFLAAALGATALIALFLLERAIAS